MLRNGRTDGSKHVAPKAPSLTQAQDSSVEEDSRLIVYYTRLWPYRWIERVLSKAPPALASRIRSLDTFKNRLLFSTLIVVSGVLLLIGMILQLIVFPNESMDYRIIQEIKTLHFVSSVVVIALGWLFIDRLCKIITYPLQELTRKADAVSREESVDVQHIGAASSVGQSGVLADKSVAFSSNDEIYRLTTSFNRMLTRLKASEARIRESEARYRFLFDHGPSPIFVIDDRDWKILDVNARATEEYQFSAEELLSMNFPDLALDIDRDQTVNALLKSCSSEEDLPPVIQHKRKDGSVFRVNFNAIRGSYRGQSAIIAAVWDATEKLEKQARLIHSSKMSTLGEMATGIAHELNQPLYIIRLGCDYLEKKIRSGKTLSGEDMNKILTELRNSVERSTRIINHLREFGRKSDQTMGVVDVNRTITNAVSLMSKQFESHAIACDLNLDPGNPKIIGNSNRLEQVFINLLVNARDAILGMQEYEDQESEESEQKFVKIQSSCDDKNVIVDFSDSGPGVSENIRSKIFEPFFTTKGRGEGTGLGLAISYQIVRDHKGSIGVSNLEHGALFRLVFPILGSGDADV